MDWIDTACGGFLLNKTATGTTRNARRNTDLNHKQ